MAKKIDTENLIYMVSSPRSGSTLVSRILDSHSQLSAPFEIGIPSFFVGDTRHNDVLKKTIKACDYYGIDCRKAVESPDYYLGAVLEKEGKSRLLVKEPRHSVMLPSIRAYHGDLRLVVLTRDSRSVCQSNMFKGDYKRAFLRWIEHYREIATYEDLFSRVHYVKYEDVTTAPEKTIASLCDFIGISFEPGMLDYWNFEHADDKMKLWDGGYAPKDHPWQAKLATAKKIEANVPKEFPDAVNKIFNASPQLQKISKRLGYI